MVTLNIIVTLMKLSPCYCECEHPLRTSCSSRWETRLGQWSHQHTAEKHAVEKAKDFDKWSDKRVWASDIMRCWIQKHHTDLSSGEYISAAEHSKSDASLNLTLIAVVINYGDRLGVQCTEGMCYIAVSKQLGTGKARTSSLSEKWSCNFMGTIDPSVWKCYLIFGGGSNAVWCKPKRSRLINRMLDTLVREIQQPFLLSGLLSLLPYKWCVLLLIRCTDCIQSTAKLKCKWQGYIQIPSIWNSCWDTWSLELSALLTFQHKCSG